MDAQIYNRHFRTESLEKTAPMATINTDIHYLLDETKPYFSDHKLERFDRSQYRDLQYTHTSSDNAEVLLSMVRGTNHPDYHGLSWLELLPTNPDDYKHLQDWERWAHEGKMKRGWKCILEMRQNPNYYLDSIGKNHWSFCKIGDFYYITQGNHRTVMARFLLSLNGLPEVIRGVSVTEIHLPQQEHPKTPLPLLKRLTRRLSP